MRAFLAGVAMVILAAASCTHAPEGGVGPDLRRLVRLRQRLKLRLRRST